jgi:hypothetical protein
MHLDNPISRSKHNSNRVCYGCIGSHRQNFRSRSNSPGEQFFESSLLPVPPKSKITQYGSETENFFTEISLWDPHHGTNWTSNALTLRGGNEFRMSLHIPDFDAIDSLVGLMSAFSEYYMHNNIPPLARCRQFVVRATQFIAPLCPYSLPTSWYRPAVNIDASVGCPDIREEEKTIVIQSSSAPGSLINLVLRSYSVILCLCVILLLKVIMRPSARQVASSQSYMI